MSGVLKVIGKIAGIVSVVAAVAGSPVVSAVAALVAVAANIGAGLLARPPAARGSVTQVLIGPDPPQPYLIGEGYYAGVLRHDTAWGATLNKVPNPYRFMATVYSGGGPVQSITPTVDKLAVDAWYSGFLFTDTQLGACPEATALAPQWAGTPGWGAAAKLSGQAAIGWSLKFDKDGKRFASGIPQLGALGQWVKVYDPRLDGTRPGGVGAHRIANEATWTWSENPALHAATYAYGRHQNGQRTFGIGLPDDAIDWVNVSAWAEVCEANGWTAFGVIYEPGDRFQNLADVAMAGGAVPILGADGLRFHYAAPRVALDTITPEDLAGEDSSVTAMATWRDRLNTLIPKYRSADHEWEMVAADAVEVASYVTEDGETKQAEWACNLVKSATQAAQICAYRLVDGRELQPIELVCGPRLRGYKPGDCLTLALPEEGLETDAVVLKRRWDPARLTVTLTLVGETPAKHAYALGLSGVAPPTPALGQSGEERDELAAAALNPRGAYLIVSKTVAYPLSSTDTTIPIAAFDGTLDDGRTLSFPADTITGLTADTAYTVLWSFAAGDYVAVPSPATAEIADQAYAVIGAQATSTGGVWTPPPDPPGGYYFDEYL